MLVAVSNCRRASARACSAVLEALTLPKSITLPPSNRRPWSMLLLLLLLLLLLSEEDDADADDICVAMVVEVSDDDDDDDDDDVE